MASDSNEEVTLYYYRLSFYSHKAQMYIREKGVHAKEQEVDIIKLENLDEWYMRMNPEGKVPMLKHGDKVVPDSHAIYLYGEEHLKGKSLLPDENREEILHLHDVLHAVNAPLLTYGCVAQEEYADKVRLPKQFLEDLKERVTSDQVKKDLEEKAAKAPADLTNLYETKLNKIKGFSPKIKDPESLKKELELFAESLKQANDQLEKSRKNGEDTLLFYREPTIADIDLAVLLYRTELLGLHEEYMKEDKVPHVCRFYRLMKQRPSFKEVHAPYSPE